MIYQLGVSGIKVLKISLYFNLSGILYTLSFVCSLYICCYAAEIGPTDHQGADLSLADGDVIWGIQENVKTFTVPTSATVTVKPYDGETSMTGMVEIHAEAIIIEGILSASGAGFSGGSGGGGGPGGMEQFGPPPYFWIITYGSGGQAGKVPYMKAGLRGRKEVGGTGDGPAGGLGGFAPGNTSEIDGLEGFLYSSSGGQVPGTLVPGMGSGGGGAGGSDGGVLYNTYGNSGAGGGAGGRGGGIIRLHFAELLSMSGTSAIHANGTLGGNGKPYVYNGYSSTADGGDVEPPELGAPTDYMRDDPRGGFGGSGSGGSIVFYSEYSDSRLELDPGSEIQAVGGRGSLDNGGALFFSGPHPVDDFKPVVNARYLYSLEEASEAQWILY